MDEITVEDMRKILPEPVWRAYEDEAHFIAERVRIHNEKGRSIIQQALTFVPWVDEVFEEPDIDVAAACSDINRDGRVRIVIDRIENGLGYSLDEETRENIRTDIWDMYNGDY